MYNLSLIDECYKKFTKNLYFWIPEGVYVINLELLNHLDLLHFQPNQERKNFILAYPFHVVESLEKLTLISDTFVVWIIPDREHHPTLTYTLIALHSADREPQLEAAFIASGVYNHSRLVLKVLEKFLMEIEETEHALSRFQETA